MPEYTSSPLRVHRSGKFEISDFMQQEHSSNLDENTVSSFGEEWEKFHAFSEEDLKTAGDQYFDIVSPEMTGKDKTALDLGCGSGRWSKYLSPQIGFIEAIDPSSAVFAAAKVLKDVPNVRLTKASSDNIPFSDNTFDLVMSLGVLHHIPDTEKAMHQAIKKLKPGGHFLVYLYYSLDNRGLLFRLLFKCSDGVRKIISSLPGPAKRFTCDLLALFIYMPFILLCRILKIIHVNGYKKIPLSYYTDKSFYIIRNDALDRFGTPLEQRFSRKEIQDMMERSGLTNIHFSENAPYWHATGRKK